MARAVGFGEIDRTRIEIVILELTRNILAHAGSGGQAARSADTPRALLANNREQHDVMTSACSPRVRATS